MSTYLICRADIAEIFEALGRTGQGAVLRATDELERDPDAPTVDEVADAIWNLLQKLPAGGKAHVETHNGERFTKCVACLEERIRELLP